MPKLLKLLQITSRFSTLFFNFDIPIFPLTAPINKVNDTTHDTVNFAEDVPADEMPQSSVNVNESRFLLFI